VNGYHALKGFEYQISVSLDLILDYFHRTDKEVLIRPEGQDDLVISIEDSKDYVQIKKPRENSKGEMTHRVWTFSEFAKEILLSSYDRTVNTQDRQIVVLGDQVEPKLVSLLNNYNNLAPENSVGYLQILHIISREKAKISVGDKIKITQLTGDIFTPIDEAIRSMANNFEKLTSKKGISEEHFNIYRSQLTTIHEKLPDMLARTKLLCTYGSEYEVRSRINKHLSNHYGLDEQIVNHYLIRNLRGFLNEAATQPDKWISREDLELEIRKIWPRMTFIGEPPVLDQNHLRRPTFVKKLLDSIAVGPTEVIGVSGSGKTLIARELMEYLNQEDNGAEMLYAEVKNNADFRDVLAGLTYSLRNFEITQPFAFAVHQNLSDARTIGDIARSLNSVEQPIILLLDLVNGSCSDEFAESLRDFLTSFRSNKVNLIVAGQESSFRRLSAFQRKLLNIPEPIYMPGFDFEEFIELIKLCHGHSYDRTVLWGIFDQLTAGRSAGLYARLAYSLASTHIDDIVERAAWEPEQIIEEADRSRYQRITENLRGTADKIICIRLPFSLEEAKTIFPSDRVVETVYEMLRFGLLRFHDEHLLEMHETIRSGLEQFIPPTIREQIHGIISDYYFYKGNIPATILHYERSGKKEQANGLAKEHFLRGKHWSSLSAYIVEHKLIESAELVNLTVVEPLHDNAYILPRLFQKLGNAETAKELFDLFKDQPERISKDYRWAWLMTEAILVCDPSMIFYLLEFGLQQQPEVLEHIVFGARRCMIEVDRTTLEMFAGQADDAKLRLIPILLQDKRREVLQPALHFLSKYIPRDSRNVWGANNVLDGLSFSDEQEVIEFIAAIPPIEEIGDILLNKSVNLGNLGQLIWKQRTVIDVVCKKLLVEISGQETVLENALRILAFSGDSDVVRLAGSFVGQKSRLGTIASFILTLFPELLELDVYKQRLFNPQLNMEERFAAFIILLSGNVDTDDWFKQLVDQDSGNFHQWEYLLLVNSVRYPCSSAIPILNKKLSEPDLDGVSVAKYAAIITKLGELPGENITDFLIGLLSSSWPEIRISACISLEHKRSKRALPALLGLCQREGNKEVGQMAIVAAIASGPKDFSQFTEIWSKFPLASIWRYILAGRLQVMEEASNLIRTACDRKEHWQVRRAAILSAGRLHSKEVMREIAGSVLTEKSTFSLDQNSSFLGHHVLADMSLEFARDLQGRYLAKKEWCHDLVAEVFDLKTSKAMFSYGTPSGTAAAKWFFEQLEANHWPGHLSGADHVNNQLHIPILHAAVLRGLRLCDCQDIIEELIAYTDTEWVLMRALCEWLKERTISKEEWDRIVRLVANNPLGSASAVKNVLNNYKPASFQKIVPYKEESKLTCRKMAYADIKQILKNGDIQTDVPLKIENLNKEQFLELIQVLSPSRDYRQGWKPTEPKVTFIDKGYSVKGTKSYSIEMFPKIRKALRYALVAANDFNIRIFWHHNLLESGKADTHYLKGVLAALGTSGDSQTLYNELEAYGDMYLMQLTDSDCYKIVEKSFDQRIVPLLKRWSHYGNDELLEVLCRIASCISDGSVDGVLAGLFHRWYQSLKIKCRVQHSDDIHLWRALNYLKSNPRFSHIPDYDFRLAELLRLNIPWYKKNDIIEILANSPRVYCNMESLLMKAAPFEHYFQDEVDRLDRAGQQLFQLSDYRK
jgi:hypothetical protein